jgi:hypothetical protein
VSDPLGRVPVQLRVGVVGHRWLTDDARSVDAVRDAVVDIRASCSNTTTEHTIVGLTVVSALAEGADRLVADAGRALGARLEVILPLATADYEQDFESDASRSQFRMLLSSAAHVTVVGPRPERDEAYLQAGKRIVDRSDVLLAIWDGQPARGVGGTAEIIEYADERATPVLWLEAQRETGITGIRARPGRDFPENISPLTPRAFRALDFFNSRQVQPDPVRERSIAPSAASEPLQPYYARADQLARRYQNWLLRSSRAIYALAVVAVATVATQLVFFIDVRWLPWVEVVALAAVTVVLILGRRLGLLRRWLSARQFAERLRIAAVLRSAGSPGPPAWGRVLEDGDWVDRSVEELWMWTDGSIPPPPLPELKRSLIEGWLAQQIGYHERTKALATARQHIAVPVTLGLFCLSLLAAILHALGWFGEGVGRTWAFISIVAPTAAAAVSGYVGQREYVRRARRSRQAAETLTRTQHEVANAADYRELHRILDRLQPELAGEAQDWSTTTTIHDLEVP